MNCYVLVGGRSKRMGQPKATLPFAGSTFFDRVVDAAQAVFDRVVAVQRAGEPSTSIHTLFESPHEDEAAIFGVERALQDANGKCFVLALDFPLITPDVLRWLSERFAASPASALLPLWKGIPQTLCAGYDSSLRDELATRIARREYSLQPLAAEAELVDEADLRSRFAGEPLMNVNTPEELQEAKRIYEQRLLALR